MSPGPAISVLLTAYNRERLVADAIRSVLDQSFADFELVIVDDGSNDRTLEVASSFNDARISIVRHEINRGIPAARNSALDHAAGKFVAWLDSDDIARPNRLAEQLEFLDANPTVAMVGSCAGKIDIRGVRRRGIRIPPFSHEDILAWQLFRSPFQQSSLMGRAETLKRYRYRQHYSVCEDVDVFIRLTREHRVANMPAILVDRRIHEHQTVETQKGRIKAMKTALLRPLLDEVGMRYSPADIERHLQFGLIGAVTKLGELQYLEWAEDWLTKLLQANEQTQMLGRSAFRFAVGFFWLRACRRATRTARSQASAKLLASSLSRGLIEAHGRRWIARALAVYAKAH